MAQTVPVRCVRGSLRDHPVEHVARVLGAHAGYEADVLVEVARQRLVALREGPDVRRVEADQVQGDLAPLGLVRREQGRLGKVSRHEVQLPREVEAVVHAGVGALRGEGGVAVAGLYIFIVNG